MLCRRLIERLRECQQGRARASAPGGDRAQWISLFLLRQAPRERPPRRSSVWSPDVSNDEEFGIFDQADLHEFSDQKGNLYGISVGHGPNREVRYLGTLNQQIAKFPVAHVDAPWHGFPLGPLEKRLNLPLPPDRPLPNDALLKMVNAGFLDNRQRKRLLKGRNI